MLGVKACGAVGIAKVLSGVEVRAQCRPVEFFDTDFGKPCIHAPRFMPIVMLKQVLLVPVKGIYKDHLNNASVVTV